MKVWLAIGLGFGWWAGMGFFSVRGARRRGAAHPLTGLLPRSRAQALLLLPLLLALAVSCALFMLHATAHQASLPGLWPALLLLGASGLLSGCCLGVIASPVQSE